MKNKGWDLHTFAANCKVCGSRNVPIPCRHDKPQHTPTPWHLHDMQMGIICDQEGKTVADIMVNHQKEHINIFNAAFIVRAVNSHDEMLQALITSLQCFLDGRGDVTKVIDQMKQAIAKAEGKI